jgi:excisionase family DNA binding protein
MGRVAPRGSLVGSRETGKLRAGGLRGRDLRDLRQLRALALETAAPPAMLGVPGDRPSTRRGCHLSDRLERAVAELVAAIREEIAAEIEASRRGPDRLLSIREAAARLGVARTTAYRLIGDGRLRSFRVGGRRLVSESAIAELIDSL